MSGPDLTGEGVRSRMRGWATPGEDPVERDARALWSALVEPGDGVAGALIAAHGARAALELALAMDGGYDTAFAADIAPDELQGGRRRWQPRLAEAAHAIEAAHRAGARLLIPGDRHWPTRVDDLQRHAPICLWTIGDASALTCPRAVAIVGARAASTYGEHVTMEIAADLAASGIAVVSGAAYGIDGMAHTATLSAGGTTAAFLAGGVDRPYPAGHRDLLERIARAGVVVAEVPCGATPTKWRFLARNRLIAAASDATVVVEAGWRSGAINTARNAADLSRPVGAVPGPVSSASSVGCHRLMREGTALCVTGPADVRELLGELDQLDLGGFDTGRTDDRTRVLDALSVRSPRPSEDVARRSGIAHERAQTLLGLLELEGAARREGRGWQAVPRRGERG